MIKTIEIKCTGSGLEDINNLIHFQGDLKNLTEESYLKFKSEILELGFSEPISIWINDNKKYILNGHMRKITLNKMRDEGYEIPLIPVSIVEADDITQAKKKVLALTSQFGKITQDGLIDFCEKNMLNIDDMMKEFRFPELPILKFEDTNFDARKEWDGMPEFNQDDLTAKYKLIINFLTIEDKLSFQKIINQTVTEKTVSLWFPKQKIESYKDESKE